MKEKFVIGLFLNYILSVTIFFISLFQNWKLEKFVFFLILSLCLLNIGTFLLIYLVRTINSGEEISSFEMKVPISEDDAKVLLKEAEALEETDQE